MARSVLTPPGVDIVGSWWECAGVRPTPGSTVSQGVTNGGFIVPALVTGRSAHRGYRHEAVYYQGEDEFLELVVPFIQEGVAAGQPVMVAVVARRQAALTQRLGSAAQAVEFVDMTDLGRNPARIIPACRDFLSRHRDDGPMRGVGEPIWAGRKAVEIEECQLHESLLNLAIAPGTPFWMLCPYDRSALDPAVIDEAARSHPVIVEPRVYRGSTLYGGAYHAAELFRRTLPTPAAPIRHLVVDPAAGHHVADWVRRWAEASGVPRRRAAGLAAALRGVAQSGEAQTGPDQMLQLWQQGSDLVCQLHDPTPVSDPMIGRRPPGQDSSRGRALLAANDLCDLVQVRSNEGGTTVRVHTWL